MAIPKYFEFMKPLLELLSDGKQHKTKDVYTFLADYFQLTSEELSERIPSGKQPLYQNRIGWAKVYLNKAGLIDTISRGTYSITEQGKAVLVDNPLVIDQRYLLRFDKFKDFINVKNGSDDTDSQPTSSQDTPQDQLNSAHLAIVKSLQHDLLSEIMTASPAFFEKLVVDLVVAMGYGGTAEDAARVVGKSGDEGIDGIIKADRLGFDQIYIQAKKWDLNRAIGRPEIHRFVGALVGQGAVKGIFITTSSFTKEAYDFVSKNLAQRVVLIDGSLLTQLLIEQNIGVSVSNILEIKRIDIDYFESGI